MKRRSFLRTALALLAGGIAGLVFRRKTALPSEERGGLLWQIDPAKCVQCGRCETECVLSESAVKCVRHYDSCGYCDFCSGYYHDARADFDNAAENRRCPTNAIERTFIEDPYFEYKINENLCTGCARCVKGCGDFGNASMYLQVRRHLCLNCNECAIARVCPGRAFVRVPADRPYIVKAGE